MDLIFILAMLVIAAVLTVVYAVRSLIVICPPNRVSVISGRGKKTLEGTVAGYRMLQGGRTIRIPLLEKVDWIELNTIAIELSVLNAYSKGAIPLNVQAVGNVKVSSKPGVLDNAVERFLGRPTEYIQKLAKETLEANLRGVLATLTPEEVNEDRLKFAQTLIDESDDDMRTLGLDLDVLKIQNVTDEVDYLDSVGRRRTASVLMEARIAEAERTADAQEAEAESRRRAEVARVESELAIAERQNALRVKQAELDAEGNAREQEAAVAGERARAVAEQSLQKERIELEKRRLEADVIAPAKARKEAAELDAKGDAAKIVEDGNAQIEVFRMLVGQYRDAGSDAEKIFVLNILPELVEKIASTVGGLEIDKISVIDSGNGQGVPNVVSQMPAAVIRMVEQIENATGVDILRGLAGPRDRQATAPVVESDTGTTPEP